MKNHEIQNLETQIYEQCQRLNELKRQFVWTDFPDIKVYTLDGEKRLSELFGDKKRMLMIHNMGSGCPYCTMWADSIQGYLSYLQKEHTILLINRETPEKQSQVAQLRGWKFTMISDPKSEISKACGFYSEQEEKPMLEPGYTPLMLGNDSQLLCGPSATFGPGDLYMGYWHMIAPFPS